MFSTREHFRTEEADRRRLERLAQRRELTDWEADRLATLTFAAEHRGFRLYAAEAAVNARAGLQRQSRKAAA